MTGEFGEDVKRTLAAHVGDRCSNPHCRALTSGPQNDRTKSLLLGVAACITAASLGGHRYDPSMSDHDRRDHGNAIWLCHSCVRLVDNDVARYSADLLRAWKKKAEAEAGGLPDSAPARPRPGSPSV